MRFPNTRLTLATLLVLCITSSLAFSHGPSAAADTFGLTVTECVETSGSSGNDAPGSEKHPSYPVGITLCGSPQDGVPGSPQRVLQVQNHLIRFPILPQGPPHRA